MSEYILTTADRPVTLARCPIGLFRSHDGTLCLKTEYGNNEGRIDAYIVDSGEFFWGSSPQTIASQRAQEVFPVLISPLGSRPMTPDIREKAERLVEALLPITFGKYPGVDEGNIAFVSQALFEAHNAGREEMEREMKPARVYFDRYCQDEADDAENCICGEQQHEDAKAFATAIRSIT